jgi:hypothetical protein
MSAHQGHFDAFYASSDDNSYPEAINPRNKAPPSAHTATYFEAPEVAYSQYPEVHLPAHATVDSKLECHVSDTESLKSGGGLNGSAAPPFKIFGLNKTKFWLLLVIVGVLVVVGVVGGGLGGALAHRKSSGSSSPAIGTSSSSATTTADSNSTPRPTNTIASSGLVTKKISSSVCVSNKDVGIQVFYQDAPSGNITYRLKWDEWESPQYLDLSNKPNDGTALASYCTLGSPGNSNVST